MTHFTISVCSSSKHSTTFGCIVVWRCTWLSSQSFCWEVVDYCQNCVVFPALLCPLHDRTQLLNGGRHQKAIYEVLDSRFVLFVLLVYDPMSFVSSNDCYWVINSLFAVILILVSQRAEVYAILLFGTESMVQNLEEQLRRQRGTAPSPLEFLVVMYVVGFIWEETQEIWREGIRSYLRNMWNFIDFSRNSLYCLVALLRYEFSFSSLDFELCFRCQI